MGLDIYFKYNIKGNLIVKEGCTNEDLDRLSIPQILNEINSYQLEGYKKIIMMCKENDIELKFI